jgi:hypothetical protein
MSHNVLERNLPPFVEPEPDPRNRGFSLIHGGGLHLIRFIPFKEPLGIASPTEFPLQSIKDLSGYYSSVPSSSVPLMALT